MEVEGWTRMQRHGFRQECGRQCAKHERGLAAHHVQAWVEAPALRFDIENGRTLCGDCHMRLHGHPLPPVLMRTCACGCGTLIPAATAMAERDGS